jgi:hypothetical protein
MLVTREGDLNVAREGGSYQIELLEFSCPRVVLFAIPQINYSLLSKLLFINICISRHILVVRRSILAKSNMGQRKYFAISWQAQPIYAYGFNLR